MLLINIKGDPHIFTHRFDAETMFTEVGYANPQAYNLIVFGIEDPACAPQWRRLKTFYSNGKWMVQWEGTSWWIGIDEVRGRWYIVTVRDKDNMDTGIAFPPKKATIAKDLSGCPVYFFD
jgi:hypothetical protein